MLYSAVHCFGRYFLPFLSTIYLVGCLKYLTFFSLECRNYSDKHSHWCDLNCVFKITIVSFNENPAMEQGRETCYSDEETFGNDYEMMTMLA